MLLFTNNNTVQLGNTFATPMHVTSTNQIVVSLDCSTPIKGQEIKHLETRQIKVGSVQVLTPAVSPSVSEDAK